MGVFDRLRAGLARTTQQIIEKFDAMAGAAAPAARTTTVDVETLDAVEELLIAADVGVGASRRIVGAVRAGAGGGRGLRELVKAELRAIFASVPAPAAGEGAKPRVILVVGGREAGGAVEGPGAASARLRRRHLPGRCRRTVGDLGRPRRRGHRARPRRR
jgi:signal recognition particle GTPase